MSFWFLKHNAKDNLSGKYINAALGMCVCYIAAYVLTLLGSVISMRAGNYIPTMVVGLIGEIFILDIFSVGYVRSLIDLSDGNSDKGYDINLVLSGFTKNYKGTLKTMFLRRLYIFGWSCLAMLPLFTAAGVIAFLSNRPEIYKLITLLTQLAQSPTDSMMSNIMSHISDNCMYVVYILAVAMIITVLLFIPYIKKVYEYEMIPMIVADNPEISSEDAFRATKEIMQGYKFNYFCLQLSLIGFYILASVASVVVPVTIIAYILMAFLMTYVNMVFVQFYLARTRTEIPEENNENETKEGEE